MVGGVNRGVDAGLHGSPARWWRAQGDKVVCELCPRECHIPEGSRGFCFVRGNRGGELVLTTYGRSSGFCIDPIEKKPLHHFLPGSAVLSLGTAGCNLGCKFCQNWDISKSRAMDTLAAEASPEAIAAAAVRTGCASIAFTYNDPTIWAEYAIDIARAARARGVRTVAVTAGYISAEPRVEFYEAMDAANVDLKAFSEDFYRALTQTHLRPVLETLAYLVRQTRVWTEVTTLLIPGHNDDERELAALSAWVVEHLGPDVPLHFTAFHPDYKMTGVPPTPPATLQKARGIARRAGLRHVYVGNVRDRAGATTWCPRCAAALVERDGHMVTAWRLAVDGGGAAQCPHCHTPIPGRFDPTGPGAWGARRQPLRILGG